MPPGTRSGSKKTVIVLHAVQMTDVIGGSSTIGRVCAEIGVGSPSVKAVWTQTPSGALTRTTYSESDVLLDKFIEDTITVFAVIITFM